MVGVLCLLRRNVTTRKVTKTTPTISPTLTINFLFITRYDHPQNSIQTFAFETHTESSGSTNLFLKREIRVRRNSRGYENALVLLPALVVERGLRTKGIARGPIRPIDLWGR